jgi:LmbE family N-acetylglucosaminyl deacetylase
MRQLTLPPGKLRVLCLGAHADDIEIGCGGTVLSLLGARPGSSCRWVVFSGAGAREQEAQASAAALGASVTVHQFRDGYFPDQFGKIKDAAESLKSFDPDLVLTHTREDRHQDHRVVSDLAWQTFRDHLVLEYEVPKYDGDLGAPNVFVPLTRDVAVRKVSHLMQSFPSQRSKRWFTEDTFLGLMRLRGVEAGAPDGFAEAFYARKAVLLP